MTSLECGCGDTDVGPWAELDATTCETYVTAICGRCAQLAADYLDLKGSL